MHMYMFTKIYTYTYMYMYMHVYDLEPSSNFPVSQPWFQVGASYLYELCLQ